MNKIYINITNHCNLSCPFCCMYSSPKKNTFMNFETFKNIINKYDNNTIIQLEGGEPFTHPSLSLFVDYLYNRGNKIIIDTNGTLLYDLSNKSEIKISINKYVLKFYNLNKIKQLSYFNNLKFNVRYSTFIEKLYFKLITFKFRKQCNYHYFNQYGKAKNLKLPKLKINNVFNNWEIYSSDGKCFNKNLIKRSEYEYSQN